MLKSSLFLTVKKPRNYTNFQASPSTFSVHLVFSETEIIMEALAL